MNMQLSRWSPWKEMEQMQQRVAAFLHLDPLRGNGKGEAMVVSEWTPRVDIIEDDRELVVKADLPEMKKDDVKVTVDDGTLTIAGERHQEKEEKGKKYHRVEREYGSFLRCFTLPDAVQADKVTAEFKDGLLTVHLPKDVKATAKPVEIKVG